MATLPFLSFFFAHQRFFISIWWQKWLTKRKDVHFTDFKVKISGWRNIVVPNHLGMNSAFTWETREHINSPPLTSQRTFPRPLGRCLPVWRWGTGSRFLGGSSSGRRRSSLGGCSFCKRKRTSIFNLKIWSFSSLVMKRVFLNVFFYAKCKILASLNTMCSCSNPATRSKGNTAA